MPAVERRRRHDVAAGVGEAEDGEGLGRLAAGHGQRPDAALEVGHALLQHRLGRIHDPGVDVAGLAQGEQGGGVVRVPEDIAGRLVDGRGSGPGGGVRARSGMDLAGFEPPGVIRHDDLLLEGSLKP